MKRYLLILALLVSSSAHADEPGLYALGVTMDYGTTFMPPSAKAGPTTMLTYRDWNGLPSRYLLFLMTAPAKPMPSTSTTTEKSCDKGGCYIRETTTTTYPSEAEIDQWEQTVDDWQASTGAAILGGEMGQDMQLDIALRALGGSANGFMFRLYRPFKRAPFIAISPYSFGYFSYPGLKTKRVVADQGVLRSVDEMIDHTYVFGGTPLRITAPLGSSGAAMVLDLDLNWVGIILDDPSPIRLGLVWVGPHVHLQVQGVLSGLRADGASLNAGASFAF